MSSVPTTPAQSGESTVIGYYFCNEPIPYRTSLPGKLITLGQFKQLISKRGTFRYVSRVGLKYIYSTERENIDQQGYTPHVFKDHFVQLIDINKWKVFLHDLC